MIIKWVSRPDGSVFKLTFDHLPTIDEVKSLIAHVQQTENAFPQAGRKKPKVEKIPPPSPGSHPVRLRQRLLTP